MISVKAKGFEDLERKLLNYGVNAWRRQMRRSFTKASRLMINAMKANVPIDTGALRKSITHKTRADKRRNRDDAGYHLVGYSVIGPRKRISIKGITHNLLYYAHLTERGTKVRVVKNWHGIRGFRMNVGRVIATHWMERAFHSTQNAAMKLIIHGMRAGLLEEARRRRGE